MTIIFIEKEKFMILAIVVLTIFLITIIALVKLKMQYTKHFSIALILLALIISISFCIKTPTMHKPISMSIINYLIKFNDDGSITTTKQTTTTQINIRNEDK